ncbi:MAG: major facilitator superfamily 1 [Sphingobacteriaceae bacterium]|jgi:ACS family hexuronate transporter-like MFS transporter|nr:major facilitator superfamily 1 [Sphingobacteriaceae bacterium]
MSSFLVPSRRRWFIVSIIFFAIIFNYFDRQIVSILKPVLKDHFKLDDAGYAIVINIFTVFYALMYPLSGWLVDKFGARIVMFGGILGWSLASLGGGISRTFGQFVFFRGMLGVAEPSNFTAQLRVVTEWFPAKMRATANSLCVAGSSIGAIIAPPLIAWIALTYSWHTVFIFAGVVGIIIAVLWITVYRVPPAEVALEAAGSTSIAETPSFKWNQLWATKSLWGILLIRFVSDPVWYFCLFWLPGYLQEQSGLSLSQLGMVGWIPFLVADLGAIGASAWSDKMVKRGTEPLKARKIMLTTLAAIAPICALTPYLPSAFSTLAIFSIVALACLTWVFNMSVVMAEVFPVKNVASVQGIAGGFGAAGAVLFNYFVGQFIGTLGAAKIFTCMAFFHPIAVVLLWTMIKKEIPSRQKEA